MVPIQKKHFDHKKQQNQFRRDKYKWIVLKILMRILHFREKLGENLDKIHLKKAQKFVKRSFFKQEANKIIEKTSAICIGVPVMRQLLIKLSLPEFQNL